MTTSETPTLRAAATDIENIPDLPSAVNSGIVGDRKHAAEGGYHISLMDQPSDNYSAVRPDDKAPPGNWPRDLAAAIDTSMSTDDMVRTWYRVEAVWANPSDPRHKYTNAFNGWNGVGSAERLDFVAGTRTNASSDHMWHCHDEWRRRYVNDPEARRAKISMYRGETIAQYLFGTPTGGNDMKLLVQDTKGGVHLVDGTWRRYIGQVGQVAGYSPTQAGSPKLLGPFGNDGQVANFGTPPDGMDVWGKDVNAPVLSQTVLDALAHAVAAQVIAADTNQLTTADLAAVTASAKAGIEQAVGDLSFTSTTVSHADLVPHQE